MFKFITQRPLWLNFLFGIAVAIIIFLLVLSSLGWLTKHNKTTIIPDVMGASYDEAASILKKKGFRVKILDSVYTDTAKPFAVIKQLPEANETVKVNRTIYLTINRAITPTIEMPNLVGYSFRNAQLTIQGFGLKVGDTLYRQDFAKNSVLEQRYNGSIITQGTPVPVGAKISLVLGSGVSESTFLVPNIVGLTFGEAKNRLEALGLGFLSIMASGITDTANAYIYRQNPEQIDKEGKLLRIRGGQTIDVWLQAEPINTQTIIENEIEL